MDVADLTAADTEMGIVLTDPQSVSVEVALPAAIGGAAVGLLEEAQAVFVGDEKPGKTVYAFRVVQRKPANIKAARTEGNQHKAVSEEMAITLHRIIDMRKGARTLHMEVDALTSDQCPDGVCFWQPAKGLAPTAWASWLVECEIRATWSGAFHTRCGQGPTSSGTP